MVKIAVRCIFTITVKCNYLNTKMLLKLLNIFSTAGTFGNFPFTCADGINMRLNTRIACIGFLKRTFICTAERNTVIQNIFGYCRTVIHSLVNINRHFCCTLNRRILNNSGCSAIKVRVNNFKTVFRCIYTNR